MSVIQSIQEKYAKVMAVIIALALITFVVMLAFENGGSLFRGSGGSNVGTIDGTKVDFTAFNKKVDQNKSYMEQQGYGTGSALEQQAVEQTWSQEVNRILLLNEAKKLGMGIGGKELGDILYGANPPADLKQQFTDPKTGVYNAAEAKKQIDNLLKTATAERKAAFNNYIDDLELRRISEKYTSLLTNSTNFPKWMVEKEVADNSQIANVSFVREFYTSIPDTTVKVSDEEISDYISKHKNDFKQVESRGVSYVVFSALPVASDTAEAKDRLMGMKNEFQSAPNTEIFLQSQGVTNYYSGFINGNKIQIGAKDSILATPLGTVYGPYLDGSSFALAKMEGVRTQPDSVTARHILIGLTQADPQTGQQVQVRDTTTALKLADSIKLAIAGGANFDSLALKFSSDRDQQGNLNNGGKYENVTAGTMVPEWNDFLFGNPVGSKAVIKTQFGYHYTEILAQKGSSAAYKVAYLTQPIEASSETEGSALNAATAFAGTSRNIKDFDANAEKEKAKGHQKAFATDILPSASDLPGLGSSRALVRNIFAADKGDVLAPERVGDAYVVAIVTEVNEKGTQTAAKARMNVEPILRNHKKAEMLAKKVGKPSTLEAAAAALGGKPLEVADSIRMTGTQNPLVASEPKVIGAAFNPANKGKLVSEVIEGTNGVYVVRVDNVSATAVGDANVAEQRKARYEQSKQRGGYPLQALMEAADIIDNRAKVY